MQQWSEFERNQLGAMQKPKQQLVECQACGSSWLEILHAVQVDANKMCTLGQQPTAEASFVILRCVRCGELHEPPVNRVFNHPESKKYDEMLDTLQEPEQNWNPKLKKSVVEEESDKETADGR